MPQENAHGKINQLGGAVAVLEAWLGVWSPESSLLSHWLSDLGRPLFSDSPLSACDPVSSRRALAHQPSRWTVEHSLCSGAGSYRTEQDNRGRLGGCSIQRGSLF